MRPNPGGGNAYYGYPYYPSSYYPYYGYYSPWYGYPYYGSHWSVGFSFGLGYGYWPAYYAPYPYPYLYPYGRYGYYGGAAPYYWNGGVTVDEGGETYTEDQRREEPSGETVRQEPPTGSLRLRVSPRAARVYVDGALAGVVDEFDGLSSHLKLPAGQHAIEFRADGYETLTLTTTVEANKTRTERASLKKQ